MPVYMKTRYRKIFRFLLTAIIALFLIFLAYNLSLIFMPFVIAFIIASILEPLVLLLTKVKFTEKKYVPRRLAVIFVVIFFTFTIGMGIFLLAWKIINEIIALSGVLSENYTSYEAIVHENIDNFINNATPIYKSMPEEIVTSLQESLLNIGKTILSSINSIVTGVVNAAVSVPQVILMIFVVIISVYFILSDKENLQKSIERQFPEKWLKIVNFIIDNIFSAFFKYIKAQMILISITFIILSIGFSIIKLEYAVLIGLVIALFDLFPVVGTGSIFIPWIIYSFVIGDTKLAISLIIIHYIPVIVRQLLEPKVLGREMGIHPLFAILAMFYGLKYFGFIGLILSPIVLMICKNLLIRIMGGKTFKEILANLDHENKPKVVIESNESQVIPS